MWLYHVTAAVRPIVGLYWRFRLTGEVDSIPSEGPAIVAANHSSFLDPWFLGPLMFPRPVRFLITRKWYDKNAFSNAVFRAYNTVPMEADPRATMDAACRVLEDGEVLGLFPEGRISYDGRIQRFRVGVCHIAARSGVPVIPLGIRGAFESLPRSRRFPKPGEIRITVGRPRRFPGSPHASTPDKRIVREFRDQLFREVCRLAGQPARVSAGASEETPPLSDAEPSSSDEPFAVLRRRA